jgi:carbon-monoxide dehydrogenase medium subunit
LKPFAYFEPGTVAEAVEILAREGNAAYPLAGGTDLLVRRKRGDISARALVNLKRIAELRGIAREPGGVRIGALATIAELEQSAIIRQGHPVLAEAAGVLGSPSIRNLGTVGGNIGRASPASDIAPALMVLNARVTVEGPQGRRTLEVERFFRGPGVTILSPGEVITCFFLPEMARGCAAVYERLGRRQGMECALVGVASFLALSEQEDEARDARIALAAVAPVPLRARKAEEVLCSGPLTEERLQESARAAAEDCMPITDMRASGAYRKDMVRVLALRALRRVLPLAAGR